MPKQVVESSLNNVNSKGFTFYHGLFVLDPTVKTKSRWGIRGVSEEWSLEQLYLVADDSNLQQLQYATYCKPGIQSGEGLHSKGGKGRRVIIQRKS